MEAKREVLNMEVESGESSTEEAELESPRSVVVKKVGRVHNRVLRIREEELHLGEDFVGGVDKENKNDVVVCEGSVRGGGFHEIRRRLVNVVLVSRPILPCSPLSGKSNAKRPWTEGT